MCSTRATHQTPNPLSPQTPPSVLQVPVLQALAAHDRVRAALAAVFAVLQGTTTGLLDASQERLLTFAREAAQGHQVLMRWIEGVFTPVVVQPNGHVLTLEQQARGQGRLPTASPGACEHGAEHTPKPVASCVDHAQH